MHITRCCDQKTTKTLEEYFADVSRQGNFREGGKAMLDLVSRLRTLPDPRNVYALTSAYRLCLLANDSYQTPWYVIISAADSQNYFVEYLMPDDVAPWPIAYVKGVARSVNDAVQMISSAMDKSEGWNTPRISN